MTRIESAGRDRPFKITVLKEIPHDTWIERRETWADPDDGNPPVEMHSGYSLDGDYIGSADYARHLATRYGIRPEKADPEHRVCSVGYSEKNGKWYGWSNHAISPFDTRAEAVRFADSVSSVQEMEMAGKIRKSGKYKGKSNRLGYGGRARQLRDRGVPSGVIGYLARRAKAAPGQKNYHGHHATDESVLASIRGMLSRAASEDDDGPKLDESHSDWAPIASATKPYLTVLVRAMQDGTASVGGEFKVGSTNPRLRFHESEDAERSAFLYIQLTVGKDHYVPIPLRIQNLKLVDLRNRVSSIVDRSPSLSGWELDCPYIKAVSNTRVEIGFAFYRMDPRE
jgi:hypothetical protein